MTAVPSAWPVRCSPGSTWRGKLQSRGELAAGELADESGKVRYFRRRPVTGSGLLVGALALAAFGDHLGRSPPLGAWALGPLSLHPFALTTWPSAWR